MPLKERIGDLSVRLPVTNGALADFTIQLKGKATKDDINLLFKKAAQNEYKGILAYSEDQLVSADIKADTHSCIIDSTLTSMMEKQVKIITWFDNEYGYTSRMIDWLLYWKKIIA